MADYSGGNVTAHIGADISDYQSAMRSVASSTQSAMQTTTQAFGSIGKTLAVTGAAITAIGVKSMSGFGDFQASLNKAAVIAGGTSKDIQGLADVANKMGADLPLSAKDAADAMVAMARDGASINTIKSEFPAIAQAATAAGADLQTTASVVQQSMNIWGDSLKSPQQSAAILTQTANLSNASIEDMQQALATIGGTANNAGIDMQTVSTALGLLTNRGFSAAQASQDLNHALLLMQAPSKKGAEMMSSLGLSMTDAKGNMKPLPQILNEIGDATANMTSSDKAAALKTMFGTAGMAAILPLMKSVKDTTDNTTTSWSAFTNEMNKASSSTQVATQFLSNQANEMQKNLGSKLEQVGGNWESLRNAAMSGSSGVLGSMADMVSGALQWASSTNGAVGSGIRTFLGLTPIIGAATLATGSFLTAATKIGSVMATLGTAMKAMFLSPIGLSVIAIAALIGIFVSAYNSSANFKKTIDSLAASLSQSLAPAIQFAQQTIGIFVKGTVAAFNSIVQQMSTMASGLKSGLDFSGLGDSVIGFVSQVVNVLTIAKNAVFDFIKGFLQTDAIKSTMKAIGSVIQAVGSIIEQVVVSSGKLFSSLGDSGSSISTFQILGSVIGNIVTVIANVITYVAGFVTYLTQLRGFNDVFTSLAIGVGSVALAFKVIATVIGIVTKSISLFNTVVGISRGVMFAFNAVLRANPVGIIITAITAVVGALIYFFSQTQTGQQIWANFVKYMSGVWSGIVQGVTSAGTTISNIWSSTVTAFQNAWSNTASFFQGLWGGVVAFFSTVWSGIMTTLQPVFNFINQGWTNLVTNLTVIWNGMVSIATGVWGLLKDAIMGPVLLILDLVTLNFNQIGADAALIWNSIVSNLTAIWNGIVSIASLMFNLVVNEVANVWNAISNTTTSVWNGIVSTLSALWNGMLNAASSFFSAVYNTIVSIWNGIPGFVSGVWNGVLGVVSGLWGAIVNTVVGGARSAWNGIAGAWGGLVGFVSGIWNGVRGAIQGAMNINLFGAGAAIMQGFLSGLKSMWGAITSFVGGIADWIRAHKGPISYDRKLLIPAGKAIMDGFGGSLNANFATVKQSVSSYAGQISDAFGKQQYVANAQLTTSSTGVAGQINGGLSALSDKVAEQQTQAPVFQVFNEIIGDKITTTVNTKNARRQATVQLMSGGV